MSTAEFGVEGAGETIPLIVIGCDMEYVAELVLTEIV
jgi:hypothetical protein